MQRYLFVHFKEKTSPDGEQVYFSLSEDGFNWEPVNGGQPVLWAYYGDKGVRDHTIIRNRLDGTYHIFATDLSLSYGMRNQYHHSWNEISRHGSKCLAHWQSADLVHWTEQELIPLGDDSFEHCPGFQGQFCYFLPIHRNRKIEHHVPDPVSILLFFWIQVNSFNERSHKLFLLDFRGSTVYFIEGQQKLVNIVARDFFLPDTLNLALYFIYLYLDFFYSTILFIISPLQIQNFSVEIGIVNIQRVHLTLQPCFNAQGLTKLCLECRKLLF